MKYQLKDPEPYQHFRSFLDPITWREDVDVSAKPIAELYRADEYACLWVGEWISKLYRKAILTGTSMRQSSIISHAKTM